MINEKVQTIYNEVKKMNPFANFRSKVDTNHPYINFFIDNRDVKKSLEMYTMLSNKYGFEGVVYGTEICGGIRK